MALVFPGGPAGSFDVARPARHWDCTGDEMKANLPTLHANLLVRLNTSAVGDAIFVAGCHADKTIVWQWCVVTKTGEQHVYHRPLMGLAEPVLRALKVLRSGLGLCRGNPTWRNAHRETPAIALVSYTGRSWKWCVHGV